MQKEDGAGKSMQKEVGEKTKRKRKVRPRAKTWEEKRCFGWRPLFFPSLLKINPPGTYKKYPYPIDFTSTPLHALAKALSPALFVMTGGNSNWGLRHVFRGHVWGLRQNPSEKPLVVNPYFNQKGLVSEGAL
jgi:hypothetical protein